MCRAISPGSQSKDSEHIFSSLESGPAPPLAAVESTSVGAGILPSFPVPLPPLFLSLRRFFASRRPPLDFFYLFAAFPRDQSTPTPAARSVGCHPR